MLFTIIGVAVLVALDQLTKYLATAYLLPAGTLPFIPGVVQLEYVLNDGAAFSLFAGNRWFLIGVTGVALAVLAGYLLWKRPANKFEYFSWLLVLGGGLGNLVDRVREGVVVDFFSLTFMDFAVFNVADCFVSVGVALLFATIAFQEVKAMRERKRPQAQEEASGLPLQTQETVVAPPLESAAQSTSEQADTPKPL